MRRLGAGLALSGVLSWAASGAACPQQYFSYSIDGYGPTEAALVELNAPLVVDYAANEEYEDEIDQYLEPTLELRVVGADAPLEVLKPLYLEGTPSKLSFVPEHFLMPGTKYQASVSLVGSSTDPSQLRGVEKKVWEFTTGDAMRAPLLFSGGWQISYEPGMDTKYDCSGGVDSCGNEVCERVGMVQVTKARITFPSVSDGFSTDYLTGSVTVRAPDSDVALAQSPVRLEPGKPGEALITVPLRNGKTYAPCFDFQVVDTTNQRPTLTNCLPGPFPAREPLVDEPEPDDVPEPDDMPEEPVDPPIVVDQPDHPDTDIGRPPSDPGATPDGAESSPHRSTACSIGFGSRGAAPWLSGVGFALAALSRRRRTRSAP